MMERRELEEALAMLGALLERRGQPFGLPRGFADRVEVRTWGGLTVYLACRVDQVALKLYAAADHWPDRNRHLVDLRQLLPTREELEAAARWCRTHDPSEGFRDFQLRPVLASLGVEVPRDGS